MALQDIILEYLAGKTFSDEAVEGQVRFNVLTVKIREMNGFIEKISKTNEPSNRTAELQDYERLFGFILSLMRFELNELNEIPIPEKVVVEGTYEGLSDKNKGQ